jgi:hypothetical protein
MKNEHEDAERRLRDLGQRLRAIFGPRPLQEDMPILEDVVRKQFAKETGRDVTEIDQTAKRTPENPES